MTRASVGLDEEHERIVGDLRERRSLGSRAETIRQCIADHPRIAVLESELEARDARVHEVESELMAANRRIDGANTAIATAEREQSLAERKARAGLGTRIWWSLRGMPEE